MEGMVFKMKGTREDMGDVVNGKEQNKDVREDAAMVVEVKE